GELDREARAGLGQIALVRDEERRSGEDARALVLEARLRGVVARLDPPDRTGPRDGWGVDAREEPLHQRHVVRMVHLAITSYTRYLSRMQDDRLARSVGWALVRAFRTVNRATGRVLQAYGLSAEQAHILVVLWFEGPKKVGELQRTLALSSGTL